MECRAAGLDLPGVSSSVRGTSFSGTIGDYFLEQVYRPKLAAPKVSLRREGGTGGDITQCKPGAGDRTLDVLP